jgi:hypothetical protein
MGDGGMGDTPSLPLPLLILISALLAVPMVFALKKVNGRAARFVIIAIWARYIMSVFHSFTFPPVIAGISLNAIGSMAVAVAGLFLVPARYFLLKSLLPLYALIGLNFLSAGMNGYLFSALDPTVKHVYFTVLMIAVYVALTKNEGESFFKNLLWAFAPLPVFQLVSIFTGVAKASELDGSVSYIGGYNHEAVFSVALATFLTVICFTIGIQRLIKALLFAGAMAAIILANYRTTLLAMLPFAAVQLMSETILAFIRRQRILIALSISVVALVAVSQLLIYAPERFSDLGLFLREPDKFIKPQAEFSFDERRLLSGRAYIWSGYLFTWIDGSLWNHILGFGPDSWLGWFKVYPHNTLLAYLFELGLSGVLVLLIFWGFMARLAMLAPLRIRVQLLFAHLSFFFINLATMAMWQIEGVIFYAILCGYSLFMALNGANNQNC